MLAAISIKDLFSVGMNTTTVLPLVFIAIMWIGVYLLRDKKRPN